MCPRTCFKQLQTHLLKQFYCNCLEIHQRIRFGAWNLWTNTKTLTTAIPKYERVPIHTISSIKQTIWNSHFQYYVWKKPICFQSPCKTTKRIPNSGVFTHHRTVTSEMVLGTYLSNKNKQKTQMQIPAPNQQTVPIPPPDQPTSWTVKTNFSKGGKYLW